MADGAVPERLKGKRLVALNLGLLLADTKYRGDFEENIKNVLEEARGSGPKPKTHTAATKFPASCEAFLEVVVYVGSPRLRVLLRCFDVSALLLRAFRRR